MLRASGLGEVLWVTWQASAASKGVAAVGGLRAGQERGRTATAGRSAESQRARQVLWVTWRAWPRAGELLRAWPRGRTRERPDRDERSRCREPSGSTTFQGA